MQNSWLSKKAEEIHSFADRKDMKKFHDALKTIYCPKSSGATPLLSEDGSTLLTDKDLHKSACENWTVYQRHAKKLNHFHLSFLRKILKIRWQDKIPDTEVKKKAKMQSVHTLLKLAQLRWTGHVTRLPYERLPKKVLYGELQEGKFLQGGQKETLQRNP